MKKTLKRLVVLLVVAAAAWWLWSNRDRIAVLSNNNVRIQGDWHPVEMEFNEPDTYTFTEHIISKNEYEWGTYVFRSNTRIEVTVRNQSTTYTGPQSPLAEVRACLTIDLWGASAKSL